MSFDKKQLTQTCKALQTKHGKGSVRMKGSKQNLVIPRISTGIQDLDEILGGGIPKGRTVVIFGPESSGKTTLAYWLAAQVSMAAMIPAEGTYDEERADAMGVDDNKMIVYQPDYGGEALDAMKKFADAGIPLQILDSIPACQPKSMIDKLDKDSEADPRIGEIARLFANNLPSLTRKCEKSGTATILINQVRAKTDAMLFGDKTDMPGGWSIKFYASIILKVARRAWIDIPNKNPHTSAATEKVGIIIKVRCTKSKVCNPYGECEIPLFFDRGFVSYDEIKPIRQELMAESRRKYGK